MPYATAKQIPDASAFRLISQTKPLHPFLLLAWLGMACCCGCGTGDRSSTAAPETALKTPADPLTDRELQRFLQVVSRLPERRVPEFSPDDDSEPEGVRSAPEIVTAIRSRFRRVFDPHRQASLWNADPAISAAVAKSGMTTLQFTALVRSLSCAIMKARLADRYNLDDLAAQCDAQISEITQEIEQLDQDRRTRINDGIGDPRAHAVSRLGRIVALREFAGLLRQVPAENVALLQQYNREITALLPPSSTPDPFANPFAPGAPHQEDAIQPAKFIPARRASK